MSIMQASLSKLKRSIHQKAIQNRIMEKVLFKGGIILIHPIMEDIHFGKGSSHELVNL